MTCEDIGLTCERAHRIASSGILVLTNICYREEPAVQVPNAGAAHAADVNVNVDDVAEEMEEMELDNNSKKPTTLIPLLDTVNELVIKGVIGSEHYHAVVQKCIKTPEFLNSLQENIQFLEQNKLSLENFQIFITINMDD